MAKEFEEEQIRAFTSNSDAFDFWKNESEDIYQDYLKTDYYKLIVELNMKTLITIQS